MYIVCNAESDVFIRWRKGHFSFNNVKGYDNTPILTFKFCTFVYWCSLFTEYCIVCILTNVKIKCMSDSIVYITLIPRLIVEL